MADGGLAIDEVPVVFGVEHCSVDVVVSEASYRIEVIPETESDELGAVAL
jgi:hypothetical protein